MNPFAVDVNEAVVKQVLRGGALLAGTPWAMVRTHAYQRGLRRERRRFRRACRRLAHQEGRPIFACCVRMSLSYGAKLVACPHARR